MPRLMYRAITTYEKKKSVVSSDSWIHIKLWHKLRKMHEWVLKHNFNGKFSIPSGLMKSPYIIYGRKIKHERSSWRGSTIYIESRSQSSLPWSFCKGYSQLYCRYIFIIFNARLITFINFIGLLPQSDHHLKPCWKWRFSCKTWLCTYTLLNLLKCHWFTVLYNFFAIQQKGILYVLFHYGSLQDTECSSPCSTVEPYCLSILYRVVYICNPKLPAHPFPVLPLPWWPQVCSLCLWACFCFGIAHLCCLLMHM